jgi:hypothetical protein
MSTIPLDITGIVLAVRKITGTHLRYLSFRISLYCACFLKVVNLQVEELNSEQESGVKAELKTVELSFQTSDQLMLST